MLIGTYKQDVLAIFKKLMLPVGFEWTSLSFIDWEVTRELFELQLIPCKTEIFVTDWSPSCVQCHVC